MQREEWLYVVETCGRRITRLRVAEDGSLSHRETFGPSDHGAFIDGIAFDAYGNLWGTHVMTDRLFAITPDGDLRILLDDDRIQRRWPCADGRLRTGQGDAETHAGLRRHHRPGSPASPSAGRTFAPATIGSLRGTSHPRLPRDPSPASMAPLDLMTL